MDAASVRLTDAIVSWLYLASRTVMRCTVPFVSPEFIAVRSASVRTGFVVMHTNVTRDRRPEILRYSSLPSR